MDLHFHGPTLRKLWLSTSLPNKTSKRSLRRLNSRFSNGLPLFVELSWTNAQLLLWLFVTINLLSQSWKNISSQTINCSMKREMIELWRMKNLKSKKATLLGKCLRSKKLSISLKAQNLYFNDWLRKYTLNFSPQNSQITQKKSFVRSFNTYQ